MVRGAVEPSAAGTCTCAASTGAHAASGFCRPEVSSCDTLWTRTFCGPDAECPDFAPWFYDVTDGSVVLSTFGSDLANSAKGRCVTSYLVLTP